MTAHPPPGPADYDGLGFFQAADAYVLEPLLSDHGRKLFLGLFNRVAVSPSFTGKLS